MPAAPECGRYVLRCTSVECPSRAAASAGATPSRWSQNESECRTEWSLIALTPASAHRRRKRSEYSAGDPAHWSTCIIDGARGSARRRVSETPGPLPWADPDGLAEQRRPFPALAYARLHENRWTASEDRLVSADDLRACVTLDGPLKYDGQWSYVIGLDLSLKDDRTVMTVCHAERRNAGGPLVVLDRIHVLQGTKARPVQLDDVERLAEQTSRAHGHARIRLDPWQGVGLAQRLRDRGISVEEWAFTAQSVGRLGQNLHMLLRDHRLALPDDADLLNELITMRLRESAPGVYRLDHDSGRHDDRAVSLGLAALALTERGTSDYGSVSSVVGVSRAAVGAGVIRMPGADALAAYALARTRGPEASITAANRAQTPAQRRAGLGFVVPESANDPRR